MALREVKPSANRFDELCAQYEYENNRKQRAEIALKKIQAQLLPYTKKHADDNGLLASESYRGKVVSFDRETIDKTKLQLLGVKPSIIKKATKTSPVEYVLVTNLEKEAEKKAEKAAIKDAARAAKARRV
jgi:hypothetical protein